jgi:hypothetical protein
VGPFLVMRVDRDLWFFPALNSLASMVLQIHNAVNETLDHQQKALPALKVSGNRIVVRRDGYSACWDIANQAHCVSSAEVNSFEREESRGQTIKIDKW